MMIIFHGENTRKMSERIISVFIFDFIFTSLPNEEEKSETKATNEIETMKCSKKRSEKVKEKKITTEIM